MKVLKVKWPKSLAPEWCKQNSFASFDDTTPIMELNMNSRNIRWWEFAIRITANTLAKQSCESTTHIGLSACLGSRHMMPECERIVQIPHGQISNKFCSIYS